LEISGTVGRHWSALIGDDRVRDSQSGTVPLSIALQAKRDSDVLGIVQKQEAGPWALTVCLRVDGVDQECQTTTAEFGIVAVRGRVKSSSWRHRLWRRFRLGMVYPASFAGSAVECGPDCPRRPSGSSPGEDYEPLLLRRD
jgi:hypothetical protein